MQFSYGMHRPLCKRQEYFYPAFSAILTIVIVLEIVSCVVVLRIVLAVVSCVVILRIVLIVVLAVILRVVLGIVSAILVVIHDIFLHIHRCCGRAA